MTTKNSKIYLKENQIEIKMKTRGTPETKLWTIDQ